MLEKLQYFVPYEMFIGQIYNLKTISFENTLTTKNRILATCEFFLQRNRKNILSVPYK